MKNETHPLQGRKITATSIDNKKITGTVELVYAEALASGTSEYVPVTHLLVNDGDECHVVRPRSVHSIKQDVVAYGSISSM